MTPEDFDVSLHLNIVDVVELAGGKTDQQYIKTRTYKMQYRSEKVEERSLRFFFFFLNDTAPPELSPLPLHDALPISPPPGASASVLPSPAPPPRPRLSRRRRDPRPPPPPPRSRPGDPFPPSGTAPRRSPTRGPR